MRKAQSILLTEKEKATLLRWARGRSTPARLVLRAQVVLRAAEGATIREIANELGTGCKTVHLWRRRFCEARVEGIEKDAPRGGRPKRISKEKVDEVVRKTTQERPPAATHWSTRTMAAAVGISAEAVRRIWTAHELKPHLVRTFKLSNDPRFAQKVEDVIGLYLNPPANALVLSADEKSQIQALDRTQPGLPLKKGRCGTMTHDYKRNGTTTLFAALCVLTGHVISACMPRHTHKEWLKFLRKIDEECPSHLDIHVICDNYATHKHPTVERWLKRHPRFHIHFTPTSASWLNLVERFFRELTDKRIRRGVFKSVPDLIAAIEEYIEANNQDPTPFEWTATAQLVLDKVARARHRLQHCSPTT